MKIRDLDRLLAELEPRLEEQELVFCTLIDGSLQEAIELEPFAVVCEDEGIAVVIAVRQADAAGLAYDGVFRRITFGVTSSLHAVGLTAAVSARLSEFGISANVIAGTNHDHILVPANRALEALAALEALSH